LNFANLSHSEDYSNDPLSPKLVIIDDLMEESCDAIVDFFKAIITRISVLFLSRRISSIRGVVNANYIVVLKNPRDRAQIRHLAHQLFWRYEIPKRGIQQRYVEALWLFAALKKQLIRTSIERVFPKIRLITSTCRVDHFPVDSYKRRIRVIVYVSVINFSRDEDE